MADQRISELTEIVTITRAEDVIPIVDVSGAATRKVTVQILQESDPNRIPFSAMLDALVGTTGTPSGSNRYVTDEDNRLGGEWTTVAYGDVTFTANGGGATWTVEAADFVSYRWCRLNSKTISCKGIILNSTPASAGSELRITAPPGVTFAGTDSFGFISWTIDGFVNKDLGACIGRTASNLLVFQKNDGSAWGSVTDLVGVVWNTVIECSVVP